MKTRDKTVGKLRWSVLTSSSKVRAIAERAKGDDKGTCMRTCVRVRPYEQSVVGLGCWYRPVSRCDNHLIDLEVRLSLSRGGLLFYDWLICLSNNRADWQKRTFCCCGTHDT